MNQKRKNNQYAKPVTVRKPKLHYIDGGYVISDNIDADKVRIRTCINIARNNLVTIYDEPMPVFMMDKLPLSIHQYFHKECNNDIETLTQHIYAARKEVYSLSGKLYEIFNGRTIKIISNNDVLYLIFAFRRDKKEMEISITHFKDEEKVAIVNGYSMALAYEDDENGIHGVSPMYFSFKDKYVENYINGSEFEGIPVVDDALISGISLISLKNILSNFIHIISIDNNLNYVDFSHTILERKIINKLVYQFSDFHHHLPKMSLSAFKNTIFDDCNDDIIEGFKLIASESDTFYDLIMNPSEECPLIDFNEKEHRFIRNYMDQTNIFTEDLDNIKPYINFIEVLENPRYGREMMVNYRVNGTPYRVHFTYDFDYRSEQLIVLVSMEGEDGVKINFKAGFVQIKTFNFGSSLYNVSVDVLYPSNIGLPRSYEEMKKGLPELFGTKDIYIEILMNIISYYCIIYVRPKRSKIIRETRRNSSNNSSNSSGNNEEFVIRRILKSASEAKKYIEEMTSHCYSDREYTIEKWPRVGHWRRLPHSDQKIWIEATTCHRKLEMSEKEIHIKL